MEKTAEVVRINEFIDEEKNRILDIVKEGNLSLCECSYIQGVLGCLDALDNLINNG